MLNTLLKENYNPDCLVGKEGKIQDPFKTITIDNQSQNEEKKLTEKVRKDVTNKFGARIISESNDIQFQAEVKKFIKSIIENDNKLNSNIIQMNGIIENIFNDIIGLGPLQPLLEDDSITEIMATSYDAIYVEKKGIMTLLPDVKFESQDHLKNVIQKIAMAKGKKIDEAEPLCDTSLPNGSRVNATFPPVTPDGPTLTIRKFSQKKLTSQDYLNYQSLNQEMINFLSLAVKGKANIIVAGGTGTGKTSLLNMVSQFVPETEAIVTIEDTLELQLQQSNVRPMLSRQAINGSGEITIRRCVKNTLRMRPDRIIVGEIRGGEIYDMLDSMSSGHEGGMGTIHTKSPRHLVDIRIPILMAMSDIKMDESSQRKMIADAIDLIVYIKRFRDGSRKITNITEVVGYGEEGASRLKGIDENGNSIVGKVKSKQVDENKIYLQDIFRFESKGYKDGKIQGQYVATGYIPKKIIEKAAIYDVVISESMFCKNIK